MSVLPDLFAENSDVDNEHLPANSVCLNINDIIIFRKKTHLWFDLKI